MARPIWKGTISFGLINIPMTLYSAVKPEELHFHLLDSRNHARVRYERVNDETGKEVPWDNIVKAYEFEKGNYVIVDEKELEKAAYENSETVELEEFVDARQLNSLYFDKPYYMVPSKQGEKGYALLRETLKSSNKAGIAKVIIKTRQHLAAILPYEDMLVLNLLRFPNEIRSAEEFETVAQKDKKTLKQVNPKEIEMAKRLIESMTARWNPKKYHDENRKLLSNWIHNKIKHGKYESKAPVTKEKKPKAAKGAQVIDFMDLLKKSIAKKERIGRTKTAATRVHRGTKTNTGKTKAKKAGAKGTKAKKR